MPSWRRLKREPHAEHDPWALELPADDPSLESALVVVAAACLVSPDLPSWWFGYAPDEAKWAAFGQIAVAEFGPYLSDPM